MRLYRICPERFLEDYSGLGASFQDGARWNTAGHPVLYFACSPATALLELANYLPSPRLIPSDYRLGMYTLPDDVSLETLPHGKLPKHWAAYPYPESTQRLGDTWLEDVGSLALLVPSAAVSGGLENIAVINPKHSQVAKIRLLQTFSDLFNERTFGGIQGRAQR
jgi:RES domain-containing protein